MHNKVAIILSIATFSLCGCRQEPRNFASYYGTTSAETFPTYESSSIPTVDPPPSEVSYALPDGQKYPATRSAPSIPIVHRGGGDIITPQGPIIDMGGGDYMTPSGPVIHMGGGDYMTPEGPVIHMGGGDYMAPRGPIINMGGGDYMTPDGPVIHMGGGDYMTPDGPVMVID